MLKDFQHKKNQSTKQHLQKQKFYLTPKEIQQQYHLSTQTLRTWHNSGKIEALQTPGGKRLIEADSLKRALGIKDEEKVERIKLCYCRVSSNHQKEDLERQVAELAKA